MDVRPEAFSVRNLGLLHDHLHDEERIEDLNRIERRLAKLARLWATFLLSP